MAVQAWRGLGTRLRLVKKRAWRSLTRVWSRRACYHSCHLMFSFCLARSGFISEQPVIRGFPSVLIFDLSELFMILSTSFFLRTFSVVLQDTVFSCYSFSSLSLFLSFLCLLPEMSALQELASLSH